MLLYFKSGDVVCCTSSAPTIQANDVFSISICLTYFGALQVQYTYIHAYMYTPTEQYKVLYILNNSMV